MHAWVFRAEDDAFEMVNDGAVGAIAEFVYVNTSQNSRGSMREDDLLHVWLRRKSN
jgi:hypothetical protein